MNTAAQWHEPLAFTGATSAAGDDDDDELLRDALAFIGDLDFELGASSPEEDDELTSPAWHAGLSSALPGPGPVLPLNHTTAFPPAPVSTGALSSGDDVESDASSTAQGRNPGGMPPKPKVINRARTRRREELAYLRGLVSELEEQLTSLQSAHEESATDTNTATSEESSVLAAAWAQVATRQYEQRQKAQTENAQLRRLLEEQIQVGKSLEHLLKWKRPVLEAPGSEATEKRHRPHVNSRSWDHELVFDELLVDCAALYNDTASMYARFDEIPPAKPHRRIQLVHDPELGMLVQTVEHRILPFKYEDTASVVWNSFLGPSRVHRTGHHDIESTEDTMKLHFHVSSDIGRLRGGFDVKMVTRLYAEATRTVIVISAIFNPTDISQTNMTGVRMRYTGWHVIEPMESSRPSSNGPTKMAVFYRAVPEVDGDLADQTRKVGTLTNFLLSTISVEIESRSQWVDDRLFELSRSSLRLGL